MKAIITKQKVGAAIDTLLTQGKETTLLAIYALLGNKGSLSTIRNFRMEILEEGAVAPPDSSEMLQDFRKVCAKAVEAGKAQKEAECAELREALDALAAESERTAEELEAAVQRASETASQLARSNEQVAAARASGEQTANKLVAAMERLSEMQSRHAEELTASTQRAHELEMAAARIEEQFNSLKERSSVMEHQRDAATKDLAQARALAEQTAAKLAASVERREQLATSHAEELRELRRQLASAEKEKHGLEMKLAIADLPDNGKGQKRTAAGG